MRLYTISLVSKLHERKALTPDISQFYLVPSDTHRGIVIPLFCFYFIFTVHTITGTPISPFPLCAYPFDVLHTQGDEEKII